MILNKHTSGWSIICACNINDVIGFLSICLSNNGTVLIAMNTVNCCPKTKLNRGLLLFHSSDEAAVQWLTAYALMNAYDDNKTKN